MIFDKIVYPNPDIPGGIALVIPSGEIPLAEVAMKDVPAGLPYRVIPAAEVPEDMTFFEAWEVDFSNPDGYGIGADAWFAAKASEQSEEVSE